MIHSLPSHLLLGLVGPWLEALFLVAALAGAGYLWSRRRQTTPGAEQPEELSPAAAEPPAPAPIEPEPEVCTTPSWVDDLTGLPDLRYLRQKFYAIQEKPSPLTLLTISVQSRTAGSTDDEPGDRALVEVAHAVRSILRANDTCVRTSTGQLMAVLPGLDAHTSGNLVRRVKHAVESLSLLRRSGGETRLAIYVGRACVPQDGSDLETLLAVARKDVERDGAPRGSGAMERLARAVPIIPN